MPAKRALVHMSCVGCGQPIPLGSVATSVTCAACAWKGDLSSDAWRWVLEGGGQTIAQGETILGETRACTVECRACRAMIAEDAIARAVHARAAAVACASCTEAMPLRSVPSEYGALATALLGEGADVSAPAGSAAPVNFACSNCGAKLDIDGTVPAPVCAFCGTRTPIPTDLWRELHPPGLVHPFFVWTSPELAAMSARSASRAEERAEAARASDKAGNVVVGVIGILVAVIAVVAGVVHEATKSAPAALFAAPNSPCNGAQSACSNDRTEMLECENDKLVPALACRGPKGCRPTEHGKSVSCDYTLATENDACNVKDSACSTDKKSELRCDGSKFVLASPCGGPDGCTITPAKEGYTLSCDDHLAPLGSPCLADGRFACASDGKSMLRCSRGHFVLASTCRGPKACAISKNPIDDTTTVACDGNVADVGDPCQPDAHACATDAQSMLGCVSGRFAVVQRCIGGCTTKGEGISCRSSR